MKAAMKNALKAFMVKHLEDFKNEANKDAETIDYYADHCISEFERYLKAYSDFKEDK